MIYSNKGQFYFREPTNSGPITPERIVESRQHVNLTRVDMILLVESLANIVKSLRNSASSSGPEAGSGVVPQYFKE